MKVVINNFHKFRTDRNPKYEDGQSYCLGKNIDIHRVDGNNFIVRTVKGNIGQFSLGEGVVPIASTVYNGVIYMIVYKESVDKVGIGIYPSPQVWTSDGDLDMQFSGDFSYLKNYTSLNYDFLIDRTTFGIDVNSFISVKAKSIYDGSVNLYITDGKNPSKVINSGLKGNGRMNSIVYTNDSFKTTASFILNPSKIPYLYNMSVNTSGALKNGVYYVIVRYLDYNYNPTEFIQEFGPFLIIDGSNDYYLQNAVDGNQVTNKGLKLTVRDIDDEFSYLEFGMIRYYEDTSEEFIIDKYYEIDYRSGTFYITGREGQISLTPAEVLSMYPDISCYKDYEIVGSRGYIANIKKKEDIDETKFKEYCLKIVPRYDYFYLSGLGSNDDSELSYVKKTGYHKDPEHFFDNRSFFRGETYPFTAIIVLNDGRKFGPYPISGYDDWDGNGPGGKTINEKGIYRFPHFKSLKPNVRSNQYGLSVKFDENVFDAAGYLNSNLLDFENVEAIIFMCGDRFVNKLYSGIGMKVFSGVETDGWGGDDDDDESILGYNKKVYFPFRHIVDIETLNYSVPVVHYASKDKGEGNDILTWMKPFESGSSKFAMYSPDYLFEESQLVKNGASLKLMFLESDAQDEIYGGYLSDEETHDYPEEVYPDDITIDNPSFWLVPYSDYVGSSVIDVTVYFVPTDTRRGPSNFSTFLGDYMDYPSSERSPSTEHLDEARKNYVGFVVDKGSNDTRSLISNRSMISPAYIGLDTEELTVVQQKRLLNRPIELWKEDPEGDYFTDVVNSADITSIEYNQILTKPMPFVGMTDDIGAGDCFMDRLYFVQMKYKETGLFGGDRKDKNDRQYQYGYAISFVCENRLNVGCRYKKEGSYYPDVLRQGHTITDFARNEDFPMPEEFYLSQCYNIHKSYRKLNGFFELPKSDHLPARIYYTDKDVIGSVIDPLRIIRKNHYKDFNVANGEIVRLVFYRDYLFSIQNYAINQHFTSQRQVKENPQGGDIVIGVGDILAEQTKTFYSYGTFHPLSIVTTKKAIYGVDMYSGCIWQASFGNDGFIVNNLTSKKEIQYYFDQNIYPSYKVQSRYGYHEDYLNEKEIITGVYFHDILFTFGSITLVFDEDMDQFKSVLDFSTNIYMNMGNSLYTHDGSSNDIFSFGNGPNLTFYGSQKEFKLEFYVTGKGEKDFSSMVKIFLGSCMNINDSELIDSITFQTKNHSYTHDFSIEVFWNKSEYKEDKLYLGIGKDAGEHLRGEWMKVSIVGTSIDDIKIKEFLSYFETSNV